MKPQSAEPPRCSSRAYIRASTTTAAHIVLFTTTYHLDQQALQRSACIPTSNTQTTLFLADLDRTTVHATDSLQPMSATQKRRTTYGDTSGPLAKRPKSTTTAKASASIRHLDSQQTDIKNKLATTVDIITRGPTAKAKAKTVALHIGMLSHQSPYLYRLALTSETKEIKLLELDSASFGIFAAWLYSEHIDFDIDGDGDAGDIFGSVLECYCLAQTLRAPAFATAVLAHACAVSAKQGLVFRNEVINAMYKRTSPGCALRRWIVDEWVWQFDNEAVSSGELEWEANCDLCNGFLFDVVVAQARRIGSKAKVRRPEPCAEKVLADLVRVAEAPESE